MKIPKEVENALKRRVNAAIKWNEADIIVSRFIDENGIDCESFDYHGGVESLVNPIDSAYRVRQAIRAKKEGDKT